MNDMQIHMLDKIQKEVHEIDRKNGQFQSYREDGECIALMHSDLSEALQWAKYRVDRTQSDCIPEFSGVEESLANVIIRILCYSETRKYNISGALKAKIEFNKNLEYKNNGNQ